MDDFHEAACFSQLLPCNASKIISFLKAEISAVLYLESTNRYTE